MLPSSETSPTSISPGRDRCDSHGAKLPLRNANKSFSGHEDRKALGVRHSLLFLLLFLNLSLFPLKASDSANTLSQRALNPYLVVRTAPNFTSGGKSGESLPSAEMDSDGFPKAPGPSPSPSRQQLPAVPGMFGNSEPAVHRYLD
jgi:hypothetical protein